MLVPSDKPIFLACGFTDGRKSINGLSLIVESSFKLNPYTPSLYVFCNRSRTLVSIIEWDGDGYWFYRKRLEQGRFNWPTEDASGSVMNLSREEFMCLLGNPGMVKKLERKALKMGTAV
jgi:transposase